VRRRDILGFAGGAVASVSFKALAQTPTKASYRIGLLSNNPWTDRNTLAFWGAYKSELTRLGWVEGRTVAFELASSDGAYNRLPAVAQELVGRKVDLITVAGGLAATAVRDATKSIPVVFIVGDDPVTIGLVGSLARPGGNLTGVAAMSMELIAKRLELLLGVARGAKLIALLTTGTFGTATARIDEETGRIASTLGLQWLAVQAAREEELASAIDKHHHVDGWFVSDTILTFTRELVPSVFARQSKPVVYPNSTFVRAGGLLSYGANTFAQARRAAWYVNRILRGTNPSELPVEQPTQVELVVNLGTARGQGISIPPSVLQRADEVIE